MCVHTHTHIHTHNSRVRTHTHPVSSLRPDLSLFGVIISLLAREILNESRRDYLRVFLTRKRDSSSRMMKSQLFPLLVGDVGQVHVTSPSLSFPVWKMEKATKEQPRRVRLVLRQLTWEKRTRPGTGGVQYVLALIT